MMISLLPTKPNMQVRAEQISMLYEQGSTIQLLGILTGFLAVGVFWVLSDHGMLLLWLSLHVIVSVVRLSINVQFAHRQPSSIRSMQNWANIYVAGTFLSGLIWGSLCLFYDASWPAPYQLILFSIYTGITAGSFNTHTPYFVAFPAFFLPPAGWLTITLLQQDTEGFGTLTALVVIYIVLMYTTALRYHRSLTRSLEVRFENERLADELACSNQRLSAQVDTDELTGLYNRRSMFHRLVSEWNRHYRSQTALSLLYVDLDFFKQYNDTYGHEAGDQCLVRVAKLLHNHALRSSDTAARFGGEEFALILPETAKKDAEKIAASIISDLAHLHLPHSASTVADHVTVSIGIATMVPHEPDNDSILRERADQMLYQAKHGGRNKFVSAQGHSGLAAPVTV
ncbi:MAG: GGDEF domain-containing protein [Sideroxydans sp.]|nr:GGDEF domain-containing protein [Sideroxydans sp.]